jgi:hypothetical protein
MIFWILVPLVIVLIFAVGFLFVFGAFSLKQIYRLDIFLGSSEYAEPNNNTLLQFFYAWLRDDLSSPSICRGELTSQDGKTRDISVGFVPRGFCLPKMEECSRLDASREMTLNASFSSVLIAATASKKGTNLDEND